MNNYCTATYNFNQWINQYINRFSSQSVLTLWKKFKTIVNNMYKDGFIVNISILITCLSKYLSNIYWIDIYIDTLIVNTCIVNLFGLTCAKIANELFHNFLCSRSFICLSVCLSVRPSVYFYIANVPSRAIRLLVTACLG